MAAALKPPSLKRVGETLGKTGLLDNRIGAYWAISNLRDQEDRSLRIVKMATSPMNLAGEEITSTAAKLMVPYAENA